MISDQFKTFQEIFSLIESGISQPYDKIILTVEVFDGYMETVLTLEADGKEITNAETNYNHARLYGLIKNLHQQSSEQGDDWKAFKLSYSPGGEVKIKYHREHTSL